MSKRKVDKLFEEIKRLAERIAEGDETLSTEEVRSQLRAAGADPDELMARFHEAATELAKRERLANRPVPLSLRQAIDTTRPDDQIPNDPAAACAFVERWLEKFRSPFALPSNLEAARAYRKSGDISERDGQDLDQLEEELKKRVKRENERKA